MATVSVLVSGLDAELRRLGYRDSTLVWYRGCWRRLERFFVTPHPGYAQRSTPAPSFTRHDRPALRITQHCS